MRQQIEFMVRKMMNRFEKLETRVESGLSKKGREVRKNSKRIVSSLYESAARNSKEEAKNDVFNRKNGFRTHRNELHKSQPKRKNSWPRAKFGSKGNFDEVNGLDRNLGSIKLNIPAFQDKMDPEAYFK